MEKETLHANINVVLASSNSGKITEFNDFFAHAPDPLPRIHLIAQTEFEHFQDAEETGHTFIENAIIKARHAAKVTGLPAIADDSGLVVPALGGEPGVYSSRYAGVGAKSADNIEKLLHRLKVHAFANKYENGEPLQEQEHQGQDKEKGPAAFFYSVIVFMLHADDPLPIVAEGYWHGMILMQPRGEKGFGYDPVFFDPNENLSAAELTLTRKNKISHRARALMQLSEKLSAPKQFISTRKIIK